MTEQMPSTSHAATLMVQQMGFNASILVMVRKLAANIHIEQSEFDELEKHLERLFAHSEAVLESLKVEIDGS